MRVNNILSSLERGEVKEKEKEEELEEEMRKNKLTYGP